MRKSTEEAERQALSLSSQKDQIMKRFGDLNIVVEFSESKSAFEPYKRPLFQQLLDLVDKGEIDGIIAWHPDRLSRNEVDASAITYNVRQGKIKDLKFASGANFDNSPESMMMLQMTMSQSQYYSSKLSKDVRRGNEKKRQMGGLTGVAPQGYLNVNNEVVVDPDRFPLIRKAFDLFLTGEYSVMSVLTILNNEWGYKTLQQRKRGGTPLSRPTMYHVFRNVRYAGLVPDPYDKEKYYKSNYPAMITVEEFDKVQSILGSKGLPRLTRKKEFSLRGFIFCGDCGCAITAQTKRKILKNGDVHTYTYYHCTGKRQGCTQKSTYVKEEDLYDQLQSLLDSYELVPEMYDWAMETLREIVEQEAGERNVIQSTQNKSISDTQLQLDRLLDMATRGLIDDKDYESKNSSLKSKLKQLQDEQSDTSLRVKNWYEITEQTFNKLVHVNTKFNNGSTADKRDILLAIGQNPVLKDGKIFITPNDWLIPVKESASSIREQLDMVRTEPQQIQKASEEAVMSIWRRG